LHQQHFPYTTLFRSTIANYLADAPTDDIPDDHPAVVEARQEVESRIETLLSIDGERTVDSFHKELGNIVWEYCGMERNEEGLTKAIGMIRELREEFWRNVKVTGVNEELNQ